MTVPSIDPLKRIMERIASHLYLNANDVTDQSLMYGRAGLALFFYHYGRYTNESRFSSYADELFDSIYTSIHASENLGYDNGLCGIASFVQHVIAEGFVEADADALQDVDQFIITKAMCDCGGIATDEHNYFSIAAYLSQRLSYEHHAIQTFSPLLHKVLTGMEEQVSTSTRLPPEEMWTAWMTDVKRGIFPRDPHASMQVMGLLRGLQETEANGIQIENIMSMFMRKRGQMIIWLENYLLSQSTYLKKTGEYFWVSYFLVFLKYVALADAVRRYGETPVCCTISSDILHTYGDMAQAVKKQAVFTRSFFQRDAALLRIGRSMYHYTQDDTFLQCNQQILATYDSKKKMILAGVPVLSADLSAFTLNRGLAGTCLAILACATEKDAAWEKLLGCYDLLAASTTGKIIHHTRDTL